jgi:hypothetical protein
MVNIMNSKDDFQQGGYFPLEYLIELFEYLKNTKNIEIITYADLAWGEPQDSEAIYEAEKRNWQKQLESGERDPQKIYVLLQHDVDSRPERSMRLIQEEARLGIPSNVMIFARRHNRKELKNNSNLQYTDYELDTSILKQAEQEHGFVIGYHCNAYEQSLYDLTTAQKRMIDDINELRKNHTIKYWSAHGGVPGPNGKNNNKIIPPSEVVEETPFFDGNYSDGGLNNKNRDPRNRNLSDFVATWRPGKRYRILTHPQYYNSPPQYNEWLGTAEWYQNIFAVYKQSGKGGWIPPAYEMDWYKNIFAVYKQSGKGGWIPPAYEMDWYKNMKCLLAYKSGHLMNYVRSRFR